MTRIEAAGRVLGLAAALGVAGCGEDARVSYTWFAEEPGFGPDLLAIEFSDGGRTRRLTGSDFTDGPGGRRDTRQFATRTSGDLVTAFWLVAGADTLSSGVLRIELRADFRWHISFHRADEDPAATCFGCVGSRAYELAPPLQESSADSLWVVWGGNSISNPVVF